MGLLSRGTIAPAFALRSTDGAVRAIASGGCIQVLIFYHTSCPACLALLPYMEKLSRMYNRSRVDVVGISQDDRAATSEAVGRCGCTFPQLIDTGLGCSRAYGVGRVPASFLLDEKAKILRTAVGFRKAGVNTLAEDVANLLGVHPKFLVEPEDLTPDMEPTGARQ